LIQLPDVAHVWKVRVIVANCHRNGLVKREEALAPAAKLWRVLEAVVDGGVVLLRRFYGWPRHPRDVNTMEMIIAS